MAATSSPPSRYCEKCGTSLDPGSLACSRCGRYTYAGQLSELSTRARQLAAMGQLQAARDHWMAAYNLLPEGSNERGAIAREIRSLDARLNPKPKTDWKKKLGPFGVVLAFLAKFKTVLLVLLTKGKVFFSLLAFLAVYWAMFGWWFAVGLCASVAIHEMGHYITVRRYGFSAELPMFLPGMGAYVKWSGTNVDVNTRAMISLAGPLFGFFSGLISYVIYLQTGHGVWLAVAHFAGWLNLLNLIPVFIFDGGSAMNALGRQERLAVLIVSLALFAILHDFLLVLVAIGAGYRIWRRDFPMQPKQSTGYYFVALVILNAFLSWFSLEQAQRLFPTS